MQNTQRSSGSKSKSSKPTMRFTNTPFPIRQQSSIISLNIQDIRTLMKKKQKQYQNDLLIQDAKRVHNFLSEVQQHQKQKNKSSLIHNKRHLKKTIQQYNNQTLAQFQNQWKEYLNKTVQEIQEVCKAADQEHKMEIAKAQEKIQEAANGKGLELIKFSRNVLELEDQLVKLVKLQRYDQAEIVNKKLESVKKAEIKDFLQKSVQKERKSLQKLKKNQKRQRQLLTSKFDQMYQKQQQKQSKQIQALVKNFRTYEISTNKVDFKVNRLLKSTENRVRSHSHSALAFQIQAIKNVEIQQHQHRLSTSSKKQQEKN